MRGAKGFSMKNYIRTYLFGAIGFALFLAQPVLAHAQSTPVGDLQAIIDGKPYAGQMLEVPSEGTSTASFRSMGPTAVITLQAHDLDAKSVLRNVVVIEMTVMGSDASASVTPGSVSWWPEGMRDPFYITEGTEAATTIALEELTLDGHARIKGQFSASICRKEGMFSAADMDDCLPIEGTFETVMKESGV